MLETPSEQVFPTETFVYAAALDQLEADITWCPLVVGVVTSHGAPEVRSFFDVGDWRSFNPGDFPCPLWGA